MVSTLLLRIISLPSPGPSPLLCLLKFLRLLNKGGRKVKAKEGMGKGKSGQGKSRAEIDPEFKKMRDWLKTYFLAKKTLCDSSCLSSPEGPHPPPSRSLGEAPWLESLLVHLLELVYDACCLLAFMVLLGTPVWCMLTGCAREPTPGKLVKLPP